MTAGPPSQSPRVTGSRTLADGENASRERLAKLFDTVLEITPIGVKFKNRPDRNNASARLPALAVSVAVGRQHRHSQPWAKVLKFAGIKAD
jgi:hypothetical protein